jgi:hypothetical protein
MILIMLGYVPISKPTSNKESTYLPMHLVANASIYWS